MTAPKGSSTLPPDPGSDAQAITAKDIENLPQAHREALLLRTQGLTIDEIAKQLGLAPAAAKNLVVDAYLLCHRELKRRECPITDPGKLKS